MFVIMVVTLSENKQVSYFLLSHWQSRWEHDPFTPPRRLIRNQNYVRINYQRTISVICYIEILSTYLTVNRQHFISK